MRLSNPIDPVQHPSEFEIFENKLAKYRKKEIHWIEFTIVLMDLKKEDSEKFKNFLNKTNFYDRRKCELFRAYDFLKIKYPEKLSEKVKGLPSTIAYLPTFRMKMAKKGHPDNIIEEMILKAVNGTPGHTHKALIKMAEPLAKKKLQEEKFVTKDGRLFDSFLHCLRLLDNLADGILEKKELIAVSRRTKGVECHELSRKLEAIFNEDFYKNLKKTKEINLEELL